MQQIPALAQARTLATGRNDDKESFFVFDEDTQRPLLSLNPCLSNNWTWQSASVAPV